MEVMTGFLVIACLAGLIVQYLIKAVPFYLITELMSVGALASVLDDFNAGVMTETHALVLVIVSIAVCIFSAWNFVNYYWPSKR